MSRSERRHHRERLKAKRGNYYSGWARNKPRVLGRLARTARPCSCFMCRQPRYDRAKEKKGVGDAIVT